MVFLYRNKKTDLLNIKNYEKNICYKRRTKVRTLGWRV